MKSKIIQIIAILALIAIVGACSKQSAVQESTANVVAEPTVSESDVKEVHIDMYDWGFNVDGDEIKAGDKVRLVITSSDGTHGIAVPGLGLSTEKIAPGQEQVLEFTASEAGTYDYYCNVPCGEGHRAMKGQIVVNP